MAFSLMKSIYRKQRHDFLGLDLVMQHNEQLARCSPSMSECHSMHGAAYYSMCCEGSGRLR